MESMKQYFCCIMMSKGGHSLLRSGHYCGEKSGVPAVIGANGVEKVMEYNLTEEELARFKACCATIRANIAKGDAILGE